MPNLKADDFNGPFDQFLARYDYQPKLTPHLDNLKETAFSQELINEITLWKTNRYVAVNSALMRTIDELASLSNGEHRQAELVLRQLLEISGIDLGMASSILRFRNPRVFQILDRHAYRAIYGEPLKSISHKKPGAKVNLYFDYLDRLVELCRRRALDFTTIDRLLYVFDKESNGLLDKND